MTLINRLIKEAKANPDFLEINAGQVRTVASHAHSLMMTTDKLTIEQLEEMIRSGKFWMSGIPLRVGKAK